MGYGHGWFRTSDLSRVKYRGGVSGRLLAHAWVSGRQLEVAQLRRGSLTPRCHSPARRLRAATLASAVTFEALST